MAKPHWNYPKEYYIFKQYLKYYFNIPPFESLNKSITTPSGADWKQSIFVLFSKRYTEHEILNLPLNRLFLEWTSENEAAGQGRIFNLNETDPDRYAKITVTTKEDK